MRIGIERNVVFCLCIGDAVHGKRYKFQSVFHSLSWIWLISSIGDWCKPETVYCLFFMNYLVHSRCLFSKETQPSLPLCRRHKQSVIPEPPDLTSSSASLTAAPCDPVLRFY